MCFQLNVKVSVARAGARAEYDVVILKQVVYGSHSSNGCL